MPGFTRQKFIATNKAAGEVCHFIIIIKTLVIIVLCRISKWKKKLVRTIRKNNDFVMVYFLFTVLISTIVVPYGTELYVLLKPYPLSKFPGNSYSFF